LRNLSDLGASVVFVSVIGDDAAGHEITKLVGSVRYAEPYLITENARPTTVKTRLVAGHHQLARFDDETCRLIASKTIKDMNAYILSAMKGCDVVVISDYAKGTLTGRKHDGMKHWGAWVVIEAAKNLGIPCVVDPKSDDYSLYSGATVITPNINELKLASKMHCIDGEEIIFAATDLIEKYQIQNMLVTRSKDGMTLVMNEGEIYNIPSVAKEVYDVTGAGDTVVAVLALGVACGFSLHDASHIANVAAGIVVGKMGTATVTAEELMVACG
jgi:D-beta-D-heptose 7-phosphate kinase/D-beta-D-heptose 1-phosphate adenosyltransferase